jgi:hypothetical protein
LGFVGPEDIALSGKGNGSLVIPFSEAGHNVQQLIGVGHHLEEAVELVVNVDGRQAVAHVINPDVARGIEVSVEEQLTFNGVDRGIG